MDHSIEKLPQEAQSQLRSDVIANCITNFVIELTENAIEAGATSIAIRINLQTFKLEIVDDGIGLTKDQLEHIGTRYYTTRWNLNGTNEYETEHRGETLASLRKCCSKLLIISKANEENITYCKVFDSSGYSTVVKAEHERPARGTAIVIENILANVPVRQACVAPSAELLKIKEYVKAISLMHPSITFRIRDDSRAFEVLRTKRTNSSLERFRNLFPRTIISSKLVYRIVARIENIKMKAMIYGELSKSRKLQFVFVNKQYVVKSEVQKYFNSLLIARFSRADTVITTKIFKNKHKLKSIFILNVSCPRVEYDITKESNDRRVIFKSTEKINSCLLEVSKNFFKKRGFEQISPAVKNCTDRKHQCSSKKIDMVELYFKRLNRASAVHGIPATRKEKNENEIYIENTDEKLPHSEKKPKEVKELYEVVDGKIEDSTMDFNLVTPSSVRPLPNIPKKNKSHLLTQNFKFANSVLSVLNKQRIEPSRKYRASENSTNQCLYKIKKDYYLKNEFKAFRITTSKRRMKKKVQKKIALSKAKKNYLHNYIFEGALTGNGKVNIFSESMALQHFGDVQSNLVGKNSRDIRNIIRKPILKLEQLHSNDGVSSMRQQEISIFPSSENELPTDQIIISPYFINIFNDPSRPHTVEAIEVINADSPVLTKSIRTCNNSPDISNFRTPSCRCSCHTLAQKDLDVTEKKQVNGNEINCVQTMTDLLTASNFHYPISPEIASPSMLFTTEKHAVPRGNIVCSEPIPDDNISYSEKSDMDAVSWRGNDSRSFQTADINLTKWSCRRNCKFMSNIRIKDVLKGVLETDSLKKKSLNLSELSEKENQNLRDMLKSYSMKNHITLDDDGNSCFRIFPHLKREKNTIHKSLNDNGQLSNDLNCSVVLTKADLCNVKFLAQIDKKFLLAVLNMNDTNDKVIVIFDQHAVEERIRVERLMKSYVENGDKWKSISINPPIYPFVASTDIDVLVDFRSNFEEKGLYFEFNKMNNVTKKRIFLTVVKVPLCLHNKAFKEGSNFNSCLKDLVELLIKEIIEYVINGQGSAKHFIPESLHDVIKYEACRGAIKFGDKLPSEICVSLLRNLSTCITPFQCAHGRPSISPLVNLTKVENIAISNSRGTVDKLKNALGTYFRKYQI